MQSEIRLWTSLSVVAGVVRDEPEFLEELNGIIKEVVDSGIYYQWIEEAKPVIERDSGVK